MPDPHEGIDADGFITTGVDRANLREPFLAAIDDAIELCRRRCSPGHSLYVYGSVATGRARVGVSDLDLLLVAAAPEDVARVADVAPALSRRHADLFREVSVATVTTAELLEDETVDGQANRCFLKHYCVCVDGDDLTGRLPRCRPTPQLAAGFGADTASVLDGIRAQLEQADEERLAPLARAAARKLLLTGAAIVSVRTGGWTTDRSRAAAELARQHPERASDLERALAWSDPSVDIAVDRAVLERFVHDVGDWVLGIFEDATTG